MASFTAPWPAEVLPLNDPREAYFRELIDEACAGVTSVASEWLLDEAAPLLEAGQSEAEIQMALCYTARSRIELEPEYRFVAARFLLAKLYAEVFGRPVTFAEAAEAYPQAVASYLERATASGLLDPALLAFDTTYLASLVRPERDLALPLMGVQTLYDRYLLHWEGQRIELPQFLWLRVAMGLALNEEHREERVRAFYEQMSQLIFLPSSPTLFNAGTQSPQLSSCFLTTIPDDLHGIFTALHDNAMLSKWSGGLGNDWTSVRALGASIRGTNGQSQGVIPFLKVANDIAIAVNQGGKRQGAVCAYLEPWHLDVEEFLDLRKNTGDDRRRTHDMHTALWIPDLFMERVQAEGEWTLFSPNEVPDLHDLYGPAFKARYEACEVQAAEGHMRHSRRLPAAQLWRTILTALYETGHPWLTWKDAANVRSMQDHAGIIHSSNLCTEILLNTSTDETAVCNLGSINVVAHVVDGKLDKERLQQTVVLAVRMLDNVIDLTMYPTEQARAANVRHRPIGLGIMGFQDALQARRIAYDSAEAVAFSDELMETISHSAILASAALAQERGQYLSYAGSRWERGELPIDTIAHLQAARETPLDQDAGTTLNWDEVRVVVRTHGMRNSQVLAIAPTATISTIAGVSSSIEPTFTNLYVKSSLSGDFTQANTALVRDLQTLGLWDDSMRDAMKYYDGSVQAIDRIPTEVRERYKTAFEIDPEWLIACASRRQKWIDQGQSLNLYVSRPTGKRLHEMYFHAWRMGLKTTYYLRTTSATQVEKASLDINRWGIQPRWMQATSASSAVVVERPSMDVARPASELATPTSVCSLDESCEACQ